MAGVCVRAAPAPTRSRTIRRSAIDPTSIAHIPGAQVVQIANFVGVVAPKEYDAIQAAAQLKVTWQTANGFPATSANFWSWLRQAGDTNTQNPPRYTTLNGNVNAALAGAAHTVSATYRYHYNIVHADRAALRGRRRQRERRHRLRAGAGPDRTAREPGRRDRDGHRHTPAGQNVRVVWYEGASSFGGGQTGEVERGGSAPLGEARQAGAGAVDALGPARLGPLRPMANIWDVTMGSDANGNIVAADWSAYGQPQSNIDETSGCSASSPGRRCRARAGSLRPTRRSTATRLDSEAT